VNIAVFKLCALTTRSKGSGISRELVTTRAPRPMQLPLSLPLGPCWELEERTVDSTTFLRSLASTFPEATTAFFEGSSIAADIVKIFEQHTDPGRYLPQPQTLWSTGTILRFRCLFTPALCEALASASLNHAEPELLDHLFLYADHAPLLEWPDAFSNCMWIAFSIPESRVKAFAASLGVKYEYADYG
jgi:hypothetical protein